MIGRTVLQDRVREWRLAEQVVEKDYVLGWVLWGIGADPLLNATWVFKGGTCLKKCYIETYRFSEDLDFTVLPGGPLAPEQIVPTLQSMLARVSEASGITFAGRPPYARATPAGGTEGRIYYQGPAKTREVARIKLDLTGNETVVRPSVLRPIAHPFPDALPAPATVRCYDFDELFAEKLRAMGERGRPRDLYDIVNLFWRGDLRAQPEQIRAALAEKCAAKGVAIPTLAALVGSPARDALETDWEQMLRHQLPELPPFAHFWNELPALFDWLEGRSLPETLTSLAAGGADEDAGWTLPPTIWVWGAGVPLETVRFAGANHLCVELGYGGQTRLIEPYSLRRTRAGQLLLYALRSESREIRAYRVDRITQATVTTRPFRPVYRVEFAQAGPITAPPSPPRAASGGGGWPSPRRAAPARTMYVVECLTCGHQFRRVRRDLMLRPHKTPDGWC